MIILWFVLLGLIYYWIFRYVIPLVNEQDVFVPTLLWALGIGIMLVALLGWNTYGRIYN